MNNVLKRSVLDFKRELQITLDLVAQKQVPPELAPFKAWLNGYYQHLQDELLRQSYYVSLNDPDIEADIFNDLSRLQYYFRLVSRNFLPGLYRSHDNDRLALKMLAWLHKQHAQTLDKAFLILDGEFAIQPTTELPLSYYLPIASQQSVLYFPLFFHELGHYLYQYHRQEMDELVGELQKKLEGHLALPFQTNSPQHQEAAERAKKIVETWYEWAQEFFCDAVGLVMGGRTYLKAFSYYLRLQGRGSFYLPEHELVNSGHPVTWLRIKFLIERARELGLHNDADELAADWDIIAQTLGINEQYYGFYATGYHSDIWQTLNDMITEAGPISFTDYLAETTAEDKPATANFVRLIHSAWEKFETAPDEFLSWEANLAKELQ